MSVSAKYLAVICAVFLLQSLADFAREEAARRERLEQEGIEAKVITEAAEGLQGNLSTSEGRPQSSGSAKSVSKNESSLRGFRSAIQKLDRSIRQQENRLKLRRARLQSLHRESRKKGEAPGSGKGADAQSRLAEEIEELEMNLKELRRERAEVYDEGKKAGFLPGELEGKGIIP